MKLAWRAQNTFDEAHALHRATYDIVVSDEPDKDRAIREVLAYYRGSAYAITSKRLDHRRLDQFPLFQGVPSPLSVVQRHDLVVSLFADCCIRSVAGRDGLGKQDTGGAPDLGNLSRLPRSAAGALDLHAADGRGTARLLPRGIRRWRTSSTICICCTTTSVTS